MYLYYIIYIYIYTPVCIYILAAKIPRKSYKGEFSKRQPRKSDYDVEANLATVKSTMRIMHMEPSCLKKI